MITITKEMMTTLLKIKKWFHLTMLPKLQEHIWKPQPQNPPQPQDWDPKKGVM